VDEPAVAGDEETGRAECDEWGAIDAESVEEQCDVVATAIETVAHRALTEIRERLNGLPIISERLPNQAESRYRTGPWKAF
jgi:phosphoribosylaminoimidazole carboxylase (NCAIR synthetase)